MSTENLFTVEEFAKRVRNGERDFILHGENSTVHFLATTHENAVFIYGRRNHSESVKNLLQNTDGKYTFLGIMSKKDLILLINEFVFRMYRANFVSLSEGMYDLTEFAESWTDKMREAFFPTFFDSLPTDETKSKWSEKHLRNEARKHLIYNLGSPTVKCQTAIYADQVIDAFCTGKSMPDACLSLLERQKEFYIKEKTHLKMLTDYIAAGGVLTPWEAEMAKAIHSVKANYLTVTFKYDEKTGEAKISQNKLLRCLHERDRFNDGDFQTAVSGRRLLDNLLPRGSHDYKNCLRCEHIIRISFRGKTLYEKVATPKRYDRVYVFFDREGSGDGKIVNIKEEDGETIYEIELDSGKVVEAHEGEFEVE